MFTLVGLLTKPRVQGDLYIKEKTLSVNVQAMVDCDGKFIAFQSGWAGSRPDIVVWQDMYVYQERHRLFAPGEYFLANGGYQLSPWVLIPYAANKLGVDGRRRQFNRQISRALQNMDDIYRSIEAMMVVHNMCHDLSDRPPSVDEMDMSDSDLDEEDEEEQNQHQCQDQERFDIRNEGWLFRERCLEKICPL
ncbi:DDE superfamily endonuclease [Ceratobasidium sp. AG-Ba]|nr:DDE superfamily endonuclease [Ceratobasidium sp. AG-Ba]